MQMRREIDGLHCARSVRLGLRLYDVKVQPSATYGSCVWATRFHMVGTKSVAIMNDIERQHLKFLKSWCHLRNSESRWMIYRELGRLPFHYYWWRDVVRFANRVAALPQDSVWHEAFRDNLEIALGRKPSWFSDLRKFLSNIGYVSPQGSRHFIDERRVLDLLCAQYDAVWHGLHVSPRLALSRSKFTTYYRWIDRGSWLDRPAYLFYDYSAAETCTYLRFCLGCHNLQIDLGRWYERRPRLHRICPRCDMHEIDDEWHMIFGCPALDAVRAARRSLFGPGIGHSVQAFMAQDDHRSVFRFVVECVRIVTNAARTADTVAVVPIVDLGISEPVDMYDSD